MRPTTTFSTSRFAARASRVQACSAGMFVAAMTRPRPPSTFTPTKGGKAPHPQGRGQIVFVKSGLDQCNLPIDVARLLAYCSTYRANQGPRAKESRHAEANRR